MPPVLQRRCVTSDERTAQGAELQDGPLETALRALSPPRLMAVGGFQLSLHQGTMAQEELMKLYSYRHVETVTDGSWGEGRCWHMAHWVR